MNIDIHIDNNINIDITPYVYIQYIYIMYIYYVYIHYVYCLLTYPNSTQGNENCKYNHEQQQRVVRRFPRLGNKGARNNNEEHEQDT